MSAPSLRPITSITGLLLALLAFGVGCRGTGEPAQPTAAQSTAAPVKPPAAAASKPAASSGAVAAPAADGVLEDRWDIMRMAGGEVGYVHSVVRKTSDASGPLFETSSETKISMKRLGTTIEITQSSTTLERESGDLVRIHSTSHQSSQATITDVTFENGKALVETESFGTKHQSTLDCPADAVGPRRIEQMALEKGLKAGTAYDLKTFVVELNGPTTVHISILGPEETELLDGKKETLTKLESTMTAMPALKTTQWVRPDGQPVKTSTPMVGITIETFAVDRERALAAAQGAATLSPDVFTKTVVVSKDLIPHPRTAESALLRIRPKSKDAALPGLADERQVVESTEGEGTILLRSSRVVPPPGKTGTRPLAPVPAELADFLASSALVQANAPEIVKIANEVVGDETDAWRAAQKLERWVEENITDKNMDIAFASALEVCTNRSGDCSEHSVLLAALCRAAGIPARSVMGLEYVGGIWGGHAWNDVWIEGEWYAIDATNGYGFVDPFHLACSKMSLAEGAFAKEFGSLLTVLGNIEIEVVELSGQGRTLRPSDAGAPEIEGDRYVDRLWGLALSKPAGFTFHPRKPKAAISNELLEIRGKLPSGERCKIEIDGGDVPADFDWHELSKKMAAKGASAGGELTVDGRQAQRFVNSAKESRSVAVVDGQSIYLIECTGTLSDADAGIFEEFLASIDFDVAAGAKN